MSDSVWPHRQQPTRLPCPWDSPGKNTGVGCHCLLQCMKVKSESEVAQCVRLLATQWTAAHQAPPSMGFSWLSIMFLLLFLLIYFPFKWPIQILHQICRNTDSHNYWESVRLLTFDHHTCSQPWIKLLKERGDGKVKQARENENIKDIKKNIVNIQYLQRLCKASKFIHQLSS